MADTITRNLSLFAAQESTEGTASAPDGNDAILAQSIATNPQQDWHQRAYQGAPAVRPGVPGAQTGPGVTFQTDIRPNGTDNTLEVDELFQACMGQVSAGTGDTTISGTASTQTSINVTSEANFTAGNMLMVEGSTENEFECAGVITAVASGVLTVFPGLSSAPTTAGKAVKEMRTFQVKLEPSAVNSLTIDVFENSGSGTSKYTRFVGCRGSFNISSPRAGSIPMVSWDFKAHSWSKATDGTRPTPTYDSASPKAAKATKLKIDTTLTDAYDIEINAGITVTPKFSQNSSNGIYGLPVTDCRPTGAFKIHPATTSVAQYTGWQAGTEFSLTQQFGNAEFGTWAYCIPKASRTAVVDGDDSGVGTNEITFEVNIQDDALATAGDAPLYIGVF